MISNLLPTEATHSSLDLFEKTPLLVTFENIFTQKIGPSFSPDGPMLEFEVLGYRNNFIDLQQTRLEIVARVVQNNGNVLQTHATEAAQRDTPYLVNNPLLSLFSECTMSLNGEKIACDFLSCDKHLISGVTIRLSLRRSPNDFVIMSEHRDKHYHVQITEANLYVRKMTVTILCYRR